MALYRVQGNGKAPVGLQVGDEVVTGGGTYRILGVNADGSYRSSLSNKYQTIYNLSRQLRDAFCRSDRRGAGQNARLYAVRRGKRGKGGAGSGAGGKARKLYVPVGQGT